jgi:hypothetical protein
VGHAPSRSRYWNDGIRAANPALRLDGKHSVTHDVVLQQESGISDAQSRKSPILLTIERIG